MAELINFIPKTAEACRGLLESLRNSPEGSTFVDRYGESAILSPSERSELARLTSAQIWEKPASAPKKNNVKKNSKKPTAKK